MEDFFIIAASLFSDLELMHMTVWTLVRDARTLVRCTGLPSEPIAQHSTFQLALF